MSMSHRSVATIPLLSLVLMTSAPRLLVAQTTGHIDVDAIGDEDSEPGVGLGCSLREAIIAANNDSDHGGCALGSGAYGTELLVVPLMTYTFTIGGTNEQMAAQGDLDILGSLEIEGTGIGNTVIDADGMDRVFHVLDSGASVTMSFLTITGGSASFGAGITNSGTLTLLNAEVKDNLSTGNGGGVNNGGTLNIYNSTFTGNMGAFGGAVHNAAVANVSKSWFANNTGTPTAGALYNGVGGTLTIAESILQDNMVTSGTGGAIRNDSSLSVTGSTLYHNSSASRGGGIYQIGSGTATITNSTITGNSDPVIGGGINNEGGTIHLVNTTLTANTPDGIYNWSDGSVTIKSSIVAVQSAGSDCAGPTAVTSGGHNIESGTACGFASAGDQQNTDPLLAALAVEGNATPTHALESNSPAIDAGPPGGCTDSLGGALLQDQRGYLRHFDGNGDFSALCDIGAYEFGSDLAGPCGFVNSLLLTNQIVDSTGTFEACAMIEAGSSFSIVFPAEVTFRAGELVILDNGFSVGPEAQLSIELDPSLTSP